MVLRGLVKLWACKENLISSLETPCWLCSKTMNLHEDTNIPFLDLNRELAKFSSISWLFSIFWGPCETLLGTSWSHCLMYQIHTNIWANTEVVLVTYSRISVLKKNYYSYSIVMCFIRECFWRSYTLPNKVISVYIREVFYIKAFYIAFHQKFAVSTALISIESVSHLLV